MSAPGKRVTQAQRIAAVLACLAWGEFAYAQHPDGTRWVDRTNGYLSVGTADIYRGLARHDRAIAFQGEIRYQVSDPFFVGVHLGQASYRAGQNGMSNDIEFDYYVGWTHQASEHAALQLRITRYTYPGSNDRFVEYDYNEVRFGLEWQDHWSLAMALSDTGLDFTGGDIYAQILWRTMVPFGLEVSAALGGGRSLSEREERYAYWDVGVSRGIGPVMTDVRYHYSPQTSRFEGRKPANGVWAISLTMGW